MKEKNTELIERLRLFMDDEGMSSVTEYGANTAEYIYKMWGGEVPLKDIRKALGEIQRER